MTDITPEYREFLRQGFLPGPRNMVFHLGFYLMWFGIAEMMVTQALAATLTQTDHEKFDLLIRGMDLRVKVERLQKAAKKYNRPIGPNLKRRLDIITKKHVPLRNRIAHSWPHHDGKEEGIVHFASIGAMPPGMLADSSAHPSKSVPPVMHVDEIFDRGLWLQAFTGDIVAAISSMVVSGGEFEISEPKSDPQPEGRQVTRLLALPGIFGTPLPSSPT